MDMEITRLFKGYLLKRGTCTLTSLLNPGLRLGVEVHLHDRLGWDSFLEGQFSALWVEHRASYIMQANLICSTNFWACGLMHRLLQITHAQWFYRNSTIHLAVKEGWTAAAHETILGTMDEFIHTDTE
jgi:hypothetical protein